MIVQEYNDGKWLLIITGCVWLLDILYRSISERKDAYRYLLTCIVLLPVTVLPYQWHMATCLTRYWYSTMRLGLRMGLLFNMHALFMTVHIIYFNSQDTIRTWLLVFSLVDVLLLVRKVPLQLKMVVFVCSRVLAFGLYTFFFVPTNFMSIYFGFVWFVQICMLPQLSK